MGHTLKQERLIQAYLDSGNISKAAKMAGYQNRQSAHHFLKNSEEAKKTIIEAIKATRDNMALRFYEMVTQTDYILDKLLEKGDLRTAIKLIEIKIKFHHFLPEGLSLPKEDGSYAQHDLSKLNIEELEKLKELLGKCEPQVREGK